MSQEKFDALQLELQTLKEQKIPGIAKRIDDARQMGDLSENAEYHAAREDMSWAQSRMKEIEYILNNALIQSSKKQTGSISIGSTIDVSVNAVRRQLTLVGAQEADPSKGKISNESPIGRAFLGHRKGDVVRVSAPAGEMVYTVEEVR